MSRGGQWAREKEMGEEFFSGAAEGVMTTTRNRVLLPAVIKSISVRVSRQKQQKEMPSLGFEPRILS